MSNKGGTHQPDSASGNGGGSGRRLGLDVPAWSLAAITLFYVFIQALIMAGGDYKTAMRIIAIVDRVRLLSVAASAVAIILSPVALMSYWTLTEGGVENNEFRHRISVGLAINILTLPFLPKFIAIGSIVVQLLVLLVDKDEFRYGVTLILTLQVLYIIILLTSLIGEVDPVMAMAIVVGIAALLLTVGVIVYVLSTWIARKQREKKEENSRDDRVISY